MWHYRLSHLSHRKLQQTLPWLSVESCECESCQLGKHHHATYRYPSSFVSERPFELIHSDIWGLAHVPSVSSFRYIIVFVDDYSRVS